MVHGAGRESVPVLWRAHEKRRRMRYGPSMGRVNRFGVVESAGMAMSWNDYRCTRGSVIKFVKKTEPSDFAAKSKVRKINTGFKLRNTASV